MSMDTEKDKELREALDVAESIEAALDLESLNDDDNINDDDNDDAVFKKESTISYTNISSIIKDRDDLTQTVQSFEDALRMAHRIRTRSNSELGSNRNDPSLEPCTLAGTPDGNSDGNAIIQVPETQSEIVEVPEISEVPEIVCEPRIRKVPSYLGVLVKSTAQNPGTPGTSFTQFKSGTLTDSRGMSRTQSTPGTYIGTPRVSSRIRASSSTESVRGESRTLRHSISANEIFAMKNLNSAGFPSQTFPGLEDGPPPRQASTVGFSNQPSRAILEALRSPELPEYSPRADTWPRRFRCSIDRQILGGYRRNSLELANNQQRSMTAGSHGIGADPMCCCIKGSCRDCLLELCRIGMSVRAIMTGLGILGICLVIAGIVLGAIDMSGSGFKIIAIVFIALGLLLIVMICVGWRCVPDGSEPCLSLCKLDEALGVGPRATRRRGLRETRPSDANQWLGGVLYAEYNYGPAPPRYVTPHPSRPSLALRSASNMTTANENDGDNTSQISVPPPYRSRNNSFTRPSIFQAMFGSRASLTSPPPYDRQLSNLSIRSSTIFTIQTEGDLATPTLENGQSESRIPLFELPPSLSPDGTVMIALGSSDDNDTKQGTTVPEPVTSNYVSSAAAITLSTISEEIVPEKSHHGENSSDGITIISDIHDIADNNDNNNNNNNDDDIIIDKRERRGSRNSRMGRGNYNSTFNQGKEPGINNEGFVQSSENEVVTEVEIHWGPDMGGSMKPTERLNNLTSCLHSKDNTRVINRDSNIKTNRKLTLDSNSNNNIGEVKVALNPEGALAAEAAGAGGATEGGTEKIGLDKRSMINVEDYNLRLKRLEDNLSRLMNQGSMKGLTPDHLAKTQDRDFHEHSPGLPGEDIEQDEVKEFHSFQFDEDLTPIFSSDYNFLDGKGQ